MKITKWKNPVNNDAYPIFQQWYKTLDWILTTVEKYPKNTRFIMASRISNLALDAMETIIEAVYTKKRAALLARLNMILEKLRVFFRISHGRRYISHSQYEYISGAIDITGRMAGGWLKKVGPHG